MLKMHTIYNFTEIFCSMQSRGPSFMCVHIYITHFLFKTKWLLSINSTTERKIKIYVQKIHLKYIISSGHKELVTSIFSWTVKFF